MIARATILVVFVVVTSTQAAFACECLGGGGTPTARMFGLYDYVFVGQVVTQRVVRDDDEDDYWEVESVFEASRVWKGKLPDEIAIRHYPGDTCAFDFRTGGVYLVCASKSRGRMTTDICTYTRSLGGIIDDIDALGQPTIIGGPPARAGGSLAWFALEPSYRPAVVHYATMPITLAIDVKQRGTLRVVFVDAKGNVALRIHEGPVDVGSFEVRVIPFRSEVLPAGAYVLRARVGGAEWTRRVKIDW